MMCLEQTSLNEADKLLREVKVEADKRLDELLPMLMDRMCKRFWAELHMGDLHSRYGVFAPGLDRALDTEDDTGELYLPQTGWRPPI